MEILEGEWYIVREESRSSGYNYKPVKLFTRPNQFINIDNEHETWSIFRLRKCTSEEIPSPQIINQYEIY